MLTEKDFTPEEWGIIQKCNIPLHRSRSEIIDVGGMDCSELVCALSKCPSEAVVCDVNIHLYWDVPRTVAEVREDIKTKKRELEREYKLYEELKKKYEGNVHVD